MLPLKPFEVLSTPRNITGNLHVPQFFQASSYHDGLTSPVSDERSAEKRPGRRHPPEQYRHRVLCLCFFICWCKISRVRLDPVLLFWRPTLSLWHSFPQLFSRRSWRRVPVLCLSLRAFPDRFGDAFFASCQVSS
ncbi:hypothetical protein MRX96_044030 [Rhipicephalus microplus]